MIGEFFGSPAVSFLTVFILTLLYFRYLDKLTAGEKRPAAVLRAVFAGINAVMAVALLYLYSTAAIGMPTVNLVLALVIAGALEHSSIVKGESARSYTLLGSASLMTWLSIYLMTYAGIRIMPVSYYRMGAELYSYLAFNLSTILACGFNAFHYLKIFPGREIKYIVHTQRYNKMQSAWFPVNNIIMHVSGMLILPLAQNSAMDRTIEVLFNSLLGVWAFSSLISCYVVILAQVRQVKDGEEIKKELDTMREKERHLKIMSEVDPLTGLLNRRGWEKKVKRFLAGGGGGCLIILDLDYFKEVNDNLGHMEGDRILQETAGMLRKTFRKEDIIGRIGGDEFYLFLEDTIAVEEKTVEERLSELLRIRKKRYEKKSGEEFWLSFSAGYAMEKAGMADLDRLIENADRALYHVKENGRCGFASYEKIKNR